MNIENILLYTSSFFVALGVLVIVHELGHFSAARLCNVKVLRFSVGFGPTLVSRVMGKNNTEWALCWIPLGGYVRMLDERESPVEQKDLPHAFNRQSLAVRFFIVAAGPCANLLFAVIVFWFMFVNGVQALKPILGEPVQGSIAQKTNIHQGDLVQSVDGKPIMTFQEFRWQLAKSVLDGASEVEIVTVDMHGNSQRHNLNLHGINPDNFELDPIKELGLSIYPISIPAVIKQVIANSRGEQAGLKDGDVVVSIDGQPVHTWHVLYETIRSSPEKTLYLVIKRGEKNILVEATPASETIKDATIGKLGIAVDQQMAEKALEPLLVTVKLNPVTAVVRSIQKTWEMSSLLLRVTARIITGDSSLKNLSGPITIADYAGKTARLGFSAFLNFLALISISLGVLNLLPIPVLDGGHLFFYLIEFFKGKPLSERSLEFVQKIGLILLFTLMSCALYNDINRLLLS